MATQALITAGRCDEALVPAKDFVKASPREPRAHGALGDVHRCAVRLRQAGLSYRKAVDLGSTDAVLLAHLAEIEAQLATLVVRVRAPTAAVPEVVVMLGDLAAPPTSFDRDEARFELMPAGIPLSVQIGGRGFEPLTLPVDPLKGTEIRRLEASPEFLGVGTVSVGSWSGGIDRVEILEGRESILVQAGEIVQLGVGETVARVTNRTGTVEIPLLIVRAREIRLEPGRWIPAGLQVTGLPTGATVEIQLGGDRSELVVTHEVPRGDGTLDLQTGALIAPPQQIDGLVAGRTILRVKHPALGVGAQAITLAPAQLNEVIFEQAQLPGTADLSARWKAHGARPGGSVNVPALGSAIAGGVALVLGGVFGGLSGRSAAEQRTIYDSYVASTGTGANAVEIFNQYQVQRGTTQDRATAAGILGGLGVIGVGVAIPLGVLVKPKVKARSTDWEPEGF